MTLHRVWLAISALVGLPIAGLGLLLLVPAAHDRSPAAVLLLIPAVLVVWAITLFVRLSRRRKSGGTLRRWILAFYTVAGTTSIWATTWDYSRDGIAGRMLSPWTTLAAALFFLFPLIHLLIFCKTTNTEPDAAPNSRPPSQLPTSPEAQAPDSLRAPSSGGCG
jgi:hypothetical protein